MDCNLKGLLLNEVAAVTEKLNNYNILKTKPSVKVYFPR